MEECCMMFENFVDRLKANLGIGAARGKFDSEYIELEKSKLVKRRRKAYREALDEYGDDPQAQNFLKVLKCRINSAEEITTEFQLLQELSMPDLTFDDTQRRND